MANLIFADLDALFFIISSLSGINAELDLRKNNAFGLFFFSEGTYRDGLGFKFE